MIFLVQYKKFLMIFKYSELMIPFPYCDPDILDPLNLVEIRVGSKH